MCNSCLKAHRHLIIVWQQTKLQLFFPFILLQISKLLNSFNIYHIAYSILISHMFVCVQRRQRFVFSRGWQCWAQASLWFSTLRENCATLSSACIIKIQTRVIMPWKSLLSTAPKSVDQYVSNRAQVWMVSWLASIRSSNHIIIDWTITCVTFIRRKALHQQLLGIDLAVLVTDYMWKKRPHFLNCELTQTKCWLKP